VKTLAYCCHTHQRSVRQAAGVQPLTCPPLCSDHFSPDWLAGYDFLYFKLHGHHNGTPYGRSTWFGDGETPAITAGQLRAADLRGATVFVATCYAYDGVMVHSLLHAGARAVIGSPGQQLAHPSALFGADLFGQAVRLALQCGFQPRAAFNLARLRLKTQRPTPAVEHALEFTFFGGIQ
jgi:hypothetical protein